MPCINNASRTVVRITVTLFTYVPVSYGVYTKILPDAAFEKIKAYGSAGI